MHIWQIKNLLTILLLLCCAGGGAFAQGGQVGAIAFDARLDDPSFTLCDPQHVYEYYMMSSYYRRQKRSIEQYLIGHYQAGAEDSTQSGYVTIRFVINCSGQTGRFRVFQLDSVYQARRFRDDIVEQLTRLVRSLKDWEPATYEGKRYDTYQYILFKMKKGGIECVLP